MTMPTIEVNYRIHSVVEAEDIWKIVIQLHESVHKHFDRSKLHPENSEMRAVSSNAYGSKLEENSFLPNLQENEGTKSNTTEGECNFSCHFNAPANSEISKFEDSDISDYFMHDFPA